jgi:hypothetical protein
VTSTSSDEAARVAAASSSRKRSAGWMTWSEGSTICTLEGARASITLAAQAMQGAVLRPTGSSSRFCGGTSGRSSRTCCLWDLFATTST